MRYFMAIMLLALPVTAMSEPCSKAGELVKSNPYTKTFKCPVSSIVVKGETYTEEYQQCMGTVPAAQETAYYTNGSRQLPLPSINSLFAKADREFNSRIWIAGKAHCPDDNSIIIDYWADGGCNGCERSVQYSFREDGSLQGMRLLKQ